MFYDCLTELISLLGSWGLFIGMLKLLKEDFLGDVSIEVTLCLEYVF